MKAQAKLEFEQILQAIRDCKKPDQKVYLVGGAVRDLLLDLPLNDFDFVTEKGSKELAKCLRKALQGASFALDDARGFNRVVLKGGTAEERFVDIAEFVGEDLDADLRARDFTINAMAIDVDEPESLIDPLGGKKDLENSILQVASEGAFESDPLRVVRAVRMMQAFELGFAPGFTELLRVATNRLGEVSSERVRDELFKILNLANNEDSLRLLWYLGILNEIFPCVPAFVSEPDSESNQAFEQRLKRVAMLENSLLQIDYPQLAEQVSALHKTAHFPLDVWRDGLKDSLDKQITRGRYTRNLLVLLALLLRQDVSEGAKSSVQAVIRYYKLSNDESSYLSRIERAYLSEFCRICQERVLSDLDLYQLLKLLKDATPGFALIVLAFTDADPEGKSHETRRQMIRDNVQALLKAWFERGQEIVEPRMLMDGVAIMDYAGLAPGPIVGELLDRLEEAQFLQSVKTVDEAKALVENYIAQKCS